ncbi:MAG: hypothetical protein J6J03_08235 [Tyzzerella sp.]|nr:hypothetical protein [Tyzzerella sp.]
MKLSVKNIALLGVMIAILEVAKNVLAFLPNVELVTLLIILYTLHFGKLTLFIVPAFILVEGCMYGFGLWWIMYAYIWPLLSLVTMLFRKQDSVWFWAIFAGLYGLLFGPLCSITYVITSGVHTTFSWWVAGIPFDIIHCISNFVLCLVLFKPLRNVMKRLSVTMNI